MRDLSHMRILVLEDEPDLRDLYEANLSDAGHDVTTAPNGLEGLKRLASDPNVIIVDLMMPVMNGYEFLEALRKIPGHEKTPALVVSAVATGAWSRRIGADAFMTKPFDNDALITAVERYAA